MASMIRLICPNLKCRKILTVPETARGKTVRCRNCAMKIRIPAGPPAPVPVESAESGDDEPTV